MLGRLVGILGLGENIRPQILRGYAELHVVAHGGVTRDFFGAAVAKRGRAGIANHIPKGLIGELVLNAVAFQVVHGPHCYVNGTRKASAGFSK